MTGQQSGFLSKTLVISSSFIIAVGVAVLAWDALMARGVLPRSCAITSLDVKGQGMLNGVYTDGDNTRLLLRSAIDQVRVITIDTCSGKVLGGLTMMADTPEALAAAQQAAKGKATP